MEKITLIQPTQSKLSHISDSGNITTEFTDRCKEYENAGDSITPTWVKTKRSIVKPHRVWTEGIMPVTIQETESEKYDVNETLILN